jgi:tetratricopeptide (TPR) repeat protein
MPQRWPLLDARIAVSKSVALFRQGAYDEAISWGEKGLRLSRRAGDDRQLAYAHDMLALSYTEQGQLTEAIGHRLDTLELYERFDDLRGLMIAHNNLGTNYQIMGELGQAIHHYQAALEHAEAVGNTTAAAVIHNNIGEVMLIEGRPEQAIEQFMETVLSYEHWGYPQAAAGLAYVNLARAHRRIGRPEEASEDLERGMALLGEAGATGLLAGAKVRKAELAIAADHLEEAAVLAQEARAEARAMAMQLVEAQALRVLAWLSLIGEDLEGAERLAAEAVELARRANADHDVGLGLLRLGEILHRAGQSTGAEKRSVAKVEEAVAIFDRLGAAQYLEWAHQLRDRITEEPDRSS